jgi:proteasome accessory factor C
MFNQNRIYRVFQLIHFLGARPSKPIHSIARRLDTSERTVYRYLDLLKDLGFDVVRDDNNRYAIPSNIPFQSLPFNPQEISYLKRLLQSSGKRVKLNNSILQKIEHIPEEETNTHLIVQAQIGQWVEKISLAILEKKQMIIEQYASANSLTISDRIIEPICFTDNYKSLAAFELTSRRCKFFNLERMGNVVALDTAFAFEHLHEFRSPDVFGFQGHDSNLEIEWIMNLRAYLLLKEEFPMCSAVVVKKDKFHLKTNVQGFIAPARFVHGMKKDVKVLGSKDFIEYLKG